MIDFPKDLTGFEGGLENIAAAVNERLDAISAVPDAPDKIVYEAMRYSLLAGGKRLRPILTVAAAELLGGSLEDALTAGCALECIHTYSLIHDDLPCMDDDSMRRGKPTCHVVFPESIALLAGDALLNTAFELLSAEGAFRTVGSDRVLTLIRCISGASGVHGMIGGQVMDLMNEKRSSVTAAELKLMHRKKTGALIRAAVLMGAVIGGAAVGDENAEALCLFADNLGLAFQIKDDILDVTGDEAVLGKPVGSDEESGKNTYVTAEGLDGAEKLLREYTLRAVNALDIFGGKAWFMRALAEKLVSRRS